MKSKSSAAGAKFSNRFARFLKDKEHETRTHHWNNGPRRLIPCGIPAFERVRSPRDYPACQHLQYFAHRSHLSGPQSPGDEAVPSSRRFIEHRMDFESDL